MGWCFVCMQQLVRTDIVQCEEVEQLFCAHALQAGVLLADDCICNGHLKFLQTHDLLLQGAPCDETIHIHHTFLKQTCINGMDANIHVSV